MITVWYLVIVFIYPGSGTSVVTIPEPTREACLFQENYVNQVTIRGSSSNYSYCVQGVAVGR